MGEFIPNRGVFIPDTQGKFIPDEDRRLNHPDDQARASESLVQNGTIPREFSFTDRIKRTLIDTGTGALIGGGMGLLTGPGAIPGAIGGGIAGFTGSLIQQGSEAGLEAAGVDPTIAEPVSRVAGAATGAGSIPALLRMGAKTILPAAGAGVVADLAVQGTEKAIPAEAPEPLKIGIPLAVGLATGHYVSRATVPKEFSTATPDTQTPKPSDTPPLLTQDPNLGNVRPVMFAGQEVGYKAFMPQPDGSYVDKYITRDGKVAHGIVAETDQFGLNTLNFVNKDGKILATALGASEDPATAIRFGAESRLTSWQDMDGGKYASFVAKAFGSDRPTMTFVTPDDTYSTTGPAYSPTKGKTIIPELDPTFQVHGWRDDKSLYKAVVDEFNGAEHVSGKPLKSGTFILTPLETSMPNPVVGLPKTDLSQIPGVNWFVRNPLEVGGETLMRAFSPFTYFRKYFGYDNPAIDALHQRIRQVLYGAEMQKWASEVGQNFQPKGSVLETEWLPVLEQWQTDNARARGRVIEARHEYQQSKGATRAAWKAEIQAAEAELQKLDAPYVQKYNQIMNRLAADPENTDIRVPLKVEESRHGGIKFDASDHENWVIQQTKDTFSNTKTALDELGVKTSDSDYMHRNFAKSPKLRDLLERTAPIFSDEKKYGFLRDAEFQERTSPVNLWPSWYDSIYSYSRLAPRIMAQRGWQNKWQDTLANSDPLIKQYADRFYDHVWGGQSQTAVDTAIDIMRSGMYLKGTGFSVLTAVKHLVGKLPLTVSQVGFGRSLEALPTTMRMIAGTDPELSKLRNTFLNIKFMFDAVMDNPNMGDTLNTKAQAFLDKAKQATMQPVSTVELFENGLSLVGSIHKAAGLDFDYKHTLNALLNVAAEANFRGGVGHPLWMSQGVGRLGSIFTWTPQSMMESVGRVVANSGQNIYSIIRGESQHQNVFGENWLWNFYRLCTIWGVAELSARSQGYSLSQLILHLPYTTGNAVAQMVQEVGQGAWREVKDWKEEGYDPLLTHTAAPVYGAAKGLGSYWAKNWAVWRQYKSWFNDDYDRNRYDSPLNATLGIERH